MKVKIKSLNGGLPEYLTEGKEYSVIDDMHEVAVIRCDFHDEIIISFFNCTHLNGGSWEAVK